MATLKYWQPNELLAILDEARKNSTRDHLMILLAYKHGLRASEIAALTLEDVGGGRLDCQRLKGSLHTNRPLESDANALLDEKKALAAYLRKRPAVESNLLFVSRLAKGLKRRAIYDVFEDACFRAGIEAGRRHPHMAKHTLGALAYRAGVDLLALQQLLGHKDIKATSFYTSVTQDEAHAAAKGKLASMFAGA